MSAFRIEPLGDEDRAAFSCGMPALDHYLKNVATQDIRRGLAKCFVAIDQTAHAIAGFYTLSATSVEAEDYPEKKNVGRYNRIPAALLGRLAIHKAYQGTGLGKALLYDAMRKIINNPIATAMIVVDAKDERAAAFYQRQGFLSFGPGRSKFYLPLKDAARLFSEE
ncbi:MAG: GNAT family N-acetyltransferase [Rhodomicrobium sp.]